MQAGSFQVFFDQIFAQDYWPSSVSLPASRYNLRRFAGPLERLGDCRTLVQLYQIFNLGEVKVALTDTLLTVLGF